MKIVVADLGEGIGGPPPYLRWRKKKWLKEEKPAEQVNESRAPSAQSLDPPLDSDSAQDKLHSRKTVVSVQEKAPKRKFVLKTLLHNCSNLSLKGPQTSRVFTRGIPWAVCVGAVYLQCTVLTINSVFL